MERTRLIVSLSLSATLSLLASQATAQTCASTAVPTCGGTCPAGELCGITGDPVEPGGISCDCVTPVPVDLEVTYHTPSIVFGPLSLGLGALPATVTARFRVLLEKWPPYAGFVLDRPVAAAWMEFGDGEWFTSDVEFMMYSFDSALAMTSLSWCFYPINTAHADSIKVLNNSFELTISGTDKASGQPFEYHWSGSTQTFGPVPEDPLPCSLTLGGGCPLFDQGASLVINEKKPGKESIKATWNKGPAQAGEDFGDLLAAGGNAYTMCVYGGTGTLVEQYTVDRAGYLCNGKPCWKAIGKASAPKGFKYKDKQSSADGISLIQLKGGDAGKTKLSVKGRNNANKGQTALPTGAASLLAGDTAAAIKLQGADSPSCFVAILFDVSVNDGTQFKAKQ